MKATKGEAVQDKQLVTYIMRHEGVSSAELAQHLGVKKRAMRDHLRRANEALGGCARIVYRRSLGGYVLAIDDEDAFTSWLRRTGELDVFDRLPSTPEERSAYLLQDLLARNGWITLEELASMLFVSRSTVSNDLKAVKESLARFSLSLEKRPRYGIRVVGPEIERRLCLANIAVDTLLKNEGIPESAAAGRVDLVERTLDDVLNANDFKINPVAHQNLIVHIAIALARIEQGCYVPMDREHVERITATDEYRVAEKIAEAIEGAFSVELPREEIAYIAIHLASKQLLESPGQANRADGGSDSLVINDEAWGIAADMIEVVWRAFRFDFRTDVELRTNLARHIMPLLVRLRYHMQVENPLLSDIKARFPLAWSMAIDAASVLMEREDVTPSEDEIGYLALSFALAIERRQTEAPKKNVLAVCASGAGSARILAYRIQHEFGEYVGKVVTCDASEFDDADLDGIDYVFTTVPLTRSVNLPVIEVTLFLDTNERQDVEDALVRTEEGGVADCFSPALFFPHLSPATREEVISLLCERAREVEHLPENFLELVMRREQLAPTSFGNGTALPHPYEAVSERTFVAVALLDLPVDWDGKQVSAVFLVSVAKDAGLELEPFYRAVTALITRKQSIRRILEDQTFEALLEELKGA